MAQNFKLLGSVGVGKKKEKYSKAAKVFVFYFIIKMKCRNKFSIQQINQEHLTAHERDKSSETDRQILSQSDTGETEHVLIFDMSETKLFRQVIHCFFQT
jgi:hypothetical protein